MAPWLPLPARIRKFRATVELYMTLKRIITARKAEGRTEEDAMQMMLDRGDGPKEIVHVRAFSVLRPLCAQRADEIRMYSSSSACFSRVYSVPAS
jgi:hypothetical protein